MRCAGDTLRNGGAAKERAAEPRGEGGVGKHTSSAAPARPSTSHQPESSVAASPEQDRAFKDHFSAQAGGYARYRPHYPEALYAYLAELAPARTRAWDCATGNGQAAVGLARHFDAVVASDASPAQLAHAAPHPRVTYHEAPAEQAPLGDASVDLVAVATALHWFHFDAFYAEVRRVLRPGGVLAAWAYGFLAVTPAVDAVLKRYYTDVVGPCWPPERRFIDEGYRTLPFPFDAVDAPAFEMQAVWTLDDLLGYLRTWSARQRYLEQHGEDPVAAVTPDLRTAWGSDAEHRVQWPLHLRVGRVGNEA